MIPVPVNDRPLVKQIMFIGFNAADCLLYDLDGTSFKWASSRQNLSSGFPTKRVSSQSPQLQRLARKNKILYGASLSTMLSR